MYNKKNILITILAVIIIVLTLFIILRRPSDEGKYDEMLNKIEELDRKNQALIEQITRRDSITLGLKQDLVVINENIQQLYDDIDETQQNTEQIYARLDDSDVGQRYRIFSEYSDTARLSPYVFYIE